nr:MULTISPECIES: hypothetical protein [Winogradskyella]
MVLLSTLSLTIEKHFCGDVLIDVAIFSESEKCEDDIAINDDLNESKTIINDCCKDEIDVIEGLSEIIITSFEDFEVIQQHVLIAYSYSYLNLFEDVSNQVIPHKDYVSPLLIKDIQVLDETYLI